MSELAGDSPRQYRRAVAVRPPLVTAGGLAANGMP